MEPREDESRLRFGRFEFVRATGELYRGGERVPLQEKPRQVLSALLDRPGEILTREALRDRLWKADTFVDFEHGLNTAIKKVRQALGDSSETPLYVETLPRRGYRFVGTVTPSSTARAEGQPTRAPWRRWAVVGIAIATAALLASLTVGQKDKTGQPSASTLRPAAVTIAVIPLRVLSAPDGGDGSDLGVGIADAITTRLANVRQIAPRPTWAVLPYRQAQSDLAHVASALGVEYLLLGTIQQVDGRHRVRVQLVRPDATAVWGRTYDEPRTGLLQVQEHIADEIATALQVELSPPERARLHVRYTNNVAAYELYLHGRALLVNYTESNMREAVGYFERALTIDERYALARAGLATACAWFSVRYAYEHDALAWGQRADTEARRALEQDPSLADAHLAIASAAGTLFGGFDWAVVLERTATALALDPSLDLAHVVRMRAFYHLGAFDEVRREREMARVTNPTPNTEASRLEVAANLFSGHFAPAAERAEQLLAETDAPNVRHYLGLARYYLGDVRGAREMLGSARRGGELDVRSQASLASIEAATGMTKEARERAAVIIGGAYMDHHVAYSLGATFAQLGDVKSAIRWLEQAVDTGFPCSPWFEQDSLLTPLRGQASFMALLDRLNRRKSAMNSRRESGLTSVRPLSGY